MKRKSIVLNDQSGFTLIEAILSLFLMTSILSFLPLMYYSYSAIDRSVSLEEDYEWNVFIIQFRNELYTVDTLRLGSNERIYLEKNPLAIKYERHGTVIRRQVNELGHEIVLQNVRKLSLREEVPMLLMTVEFMNGTIEQASFLLPVQEVEMP